MEHGSLKFFVAVSKEETGVSWLPGCSVIVSSSPHTAASTSAQVRPFVQRAWRRT
jgi:hypothetical protein